MAMMLARADAAQCDRSASRGQFALLVAGHVLMVERVTSRDATRSGGAVLPLVAGTLGLTTDGQTPFVSAMNVSREAWLSARLLRCAFDAELAGSVRSRAPPHHEREGERREEWQ